MFISYAQNYEDVMLWRALKHVERGFYIDVGAWSPDHDTVTKAFYERGWNGINIEPNPEFNQQLQERRPRDINLLVAVGDCKSILTMNYIGNPGLSTLDDTIAEKHRAAGLSVDRQEVLVTTLAALWQTYVPEGQPVHFLKVDVEGFEEAVLRGNDWSRYRPWIVVVEAMLPMCQVESHEAWEPRLLEAGYKFVYADGLNRFYVAQEHSELLPAFKYPPNVFDEFKLIGQQEAETKAQLAEAQAAQANERANQAEAFAAMVKKQLNVSVKQPMEAITQANLIDKYHKYHNKAIMTNKAQLVEQEQARLTSSKELIRASIAFIEKALEEIHENNQYILEYSLIKKLLEQAESISEIAFRIPLQVIAINFLQRVGEKEIRDKLIMELNRMIALPANQKVYYPFKNYIDWIEKRDEQYQNAKQNYDLFIQSDDLFTEIENNPEIFTSELLDIIRQNAINSSMEGNAELSKRLFELIELIYKVIPELSQQNQKIESRTPNENQQLLKILDALVINLFN